MTVLEEVRDELRPLLDEVGSRNHVRVTVHRAMPPGKGKRWAWRPGELVHDSRVDDGDAVILLPALAMLDHLRALKGLPAKWLEEAVRQTGGELVGVTPNLRPTSGIDYVASQLGGAAGTTIATYIGLSNSTGTLDAADTATRTGAAGTGVNWGTPQPADAAAGTGRGEYTALGMTRALATYAHTTNVANYTMTKQFTATAAVTALQVCGLFTAATQGSGILFVENNYTATSLASGDSLTIAWTVTV